MPWISPAVTPESNDADLLAETSEASITSSKLTLGCTAAGLPAALTENEEANALVMSEALIARDVTAESSFFISAFPFRALCSIYWITSDNYLRSPFAQGRVTRLTMLWMIASESSELISAPPFSSQQSALSLP